MLVLPALYVISTIAALLIATYTDLKERIVPNRLIYAIILAGILLKCAESYIAGNMGPLILSGQGTIIAFAVSYALYALGVWAGGDVKLVSSLAILNPINYALVAQELGLQWPFTPIPLPIFAVSLIIYSALAVLPLGFAMSIIATAKNRDVLSQTLGQTAKKWKQLIGAAAVISAARIIFAEFWINELLILPLLIAIIFLPREYRTGAAIALAVAGALASPADFAYNFLAIAVPLMIGYALWNIYVNSRENAFKQTINTSELEEGMVPDRHIVENGGKIEFVEGPSIKTVIKQLMSNNMEKALADFTIKGRKISGGPGNAGGLTQEEAREIREKASKGLAPKTIVVKRTMPFVPAMLVAYIALQMSGDALWNILFR